MAYEKCVVGNFNCRVQVTMAGKIYCFKSRVDADMWAESGFTDQQGLKSGLVLAITPEPAQGTAEAE